MGDRKAREKTSQALREKAPLLRKQQEEQRKEKLTQKDLPKVSVKKKLYVCMYVSTEWLIYLFIGGWEALI